MNRGQGPGLGLSGLFYSMQDKGRGSFPLCFSSVFILQKYNLPVHISGFPELILFHPSILLKTAFSIVK
ncbi:MAG: hypothetical protein CVV49_04560 [Spirochaetae bacterium HGW-Spirochaetae-5]|nr:MAG: hypothetical protein CVV49_04560 [Spirochaetae bacterium HGW-Spirochaetae-5]